MALQSLPVELLLDITDYLQLPAKIALGVTCRRLLHILRTTKWKTIHNPSRADLLRLLSRDTPDIQFCVPCNTLHGLEEVSLQTKYKRSFGATGEDSAVFRTALKFTDILAPSSGANGDDEPTTILEVSPAQVQLARLRLLRYHHSPLNKGTCPKSLTRSHRHTVHLPSADGLPGFQAKIRWQFRPSIRFNLKLQRVVHLTLPFPVWDDPFMIEKRALEEKAVRGVHRTGGDEEGGKRLAWRKTFRDTYYNERWLLEFQPPREEVEPGFAQLRRVLDRLDLACCSHCKPGSVTGAIICKLIQEMGFSYTDYCTSIRNGLVQCSDCSQHRHRVYVCGCAVDFNVVMGKRGEIRIEYMYEFGEDGYICRQEAEGPCFGVKIPNSMPLR